MKRSEYSVSRNGGSKRTYKPHNIQNKKTENPRDDDTKGLKKAMVVLPLVIIIIIICALIAGIRQYTSLKPDDDAGSSMQSSEEKPTVEENKLLLVVSPETPLPSDYKLELAAFGDIQVDRGVIPDLEEMMDAVAEDGIGLVAAEGYISEEIQHKLYQNEVRRITAEGIPENSAEEQAMRKYPPENMCEKQTGLCVTFKNKDNSSFEGSKAYRWLMENASRYGFVLRYPEGKEKDTGMDPDPALFRYVGAKYAKKMKTLNMCLDEYTAYLASRN